jgi:hypothetical protein
MHDKFVRIFRETPMRRKSSHYEAGLKIGTPCYAFDGLLLKIIQGTFHFFPVSRNFETPSGESKNTCKRHLKIVEAIQRLATGIDRKVSGIRCL